MTVFFDTSAAVKLLLREPGSERAGEIWALASRRVASRLLYPELRAALAAARRTRRLGARGFALAKADAGVMFEAMHVIEIDAEVATEAGDLAERHALRAADAIHLTSAIRAGGPTMPVVTWDQDLARAARACGYAVVPGHGG